MPETIKNIPKSQAEITNNNIHPYIPELGKPPVDVSKRGNDVSLRGEDIKDISNGFQDIVDGIMYYFKEVIKCSVIEEGTRINIPVIYAAPERWKSAQRDGAFRDKEGQVLFPVISVKLDNIEKNRELGNKLDGNKVHNYQIYKKRYSNKNFYDTFSVLTNRVPVEEYGSFIVPDYHKLTFTCVIYTNMMEDILRIIEDIFYRSDSYWGQPNKFTYQARIDAMPITQQIEQGDDRKFMSQFNIVLNGYVIPDSINKFLTTDYKRFFSKAQVVFKTEVVGGIDITTANIGKASSVVSYPIPTRSAGGGSGTIDPNILTYLNTNKMVLATTVTTTTAIFPASFLPSPTPSLPPTDVSKFEFFVNGQLLEPNGIVSFVDNGDNTCTLVINPAEVGFSFISTWEVYAVGKFA